MIASIALPTASLAPLMVLDMVLVMPVQILDVVVEISFHIPEMKLPIPPRASLAPCTKPDMTSTRLDHTAEPVATRASHVADSTWQMASQLTIMAITAAIAATMAPIGNSAAPIDAPNTPNTVAMAVITGAKALSPANSPPTTSMPCCTGAGRSLNHWTTSLITGTISLINGATADAIVPPTSAMTAWNCCMAICCWSISSNVASNVALTEPWLSCAALVNWLKLKAPRLMASTILAAPFVPNVALAVARASVSLLAFLILSIVCASPSLRLIPCLA